MRRQNFNTLIIFINVKWGRSLMYHSFHEMKWELSLKHHSFYVHKMVFLIILDSCNYVENSQCFNQEKV